MLTLASLAGLRAGEIGDLERDDIIEAKGLIRVRHGKGDKERIVPLHPEVLEALRCLPMPKTGAIFTRPRGSRHTGATVSQTVNRYLDELGIDATLHAGRHWFATSIYARTHDIRVTQELLGHRTRAPRPRTSPIHTSTRRRLWHRCLSAPEAVIREKELGFDAQLAATEIVRRCERRIGELTQRGPGRPKETDRVGSVFSGGHERTDHYAMAGASPDDFDAAIAEARAEKNLSRANVVRKLQADRSQH